MCLVKPLLPASNAAVLVSPTPATHEALILCVFQFLFFNQTASYKILLRISAKKKCDERAPHQSRKEWLDY